MEKQKSLVSIEDYCKNSNLSDLSRVAFSSGFIQVDEYIKNEAYSRCLNNSAGTSLLLEDNEIIGYFSISVGHLDIENRTDTKFLGIEKYWPTLFLHELGVIKERQSHGYGSSLLINLFKRTLRVRDELQIGIGGILIQSNPNDKTVDFYLRRGFKFLNQRDEDEFGSIETDPDDRGFCIPRNDAVSMYISISEIKVQVELYD